MATRNTAFRALCVSVGKKEREDMLFLLNGPSSPVEALGEKGNKLSADNYTRRNDRAVYGLVRGLIIEIS